MRVGRGRNLGKAKWRQLLEEWRASGLTQAAFCTRRGIHPATFSGRKQQLALWLAKAPPSEPHPTAERAASPRGARGMRRRRGAQAAFVEARLSDTPLALAPGAHTSRPRQDAGLELVIGERLSIRVSSDFDVGALRSVLRALGHSP